MGDGGAWVAQSGKHLTLDLSSGLDRKVVSSSPASCSALGMKLLKKEKKEKKRNLWSTVESYSSSDFTSVMTHNLLHDRVQVNSLEACIMGTLGSCESSAFHN